VCPEARASDFALEDVVVLARFVAAVEGCRVSSGWVVALMRATEISEPGRRSAGIYRYTAGLVMPRRGSH
jgi:hypothetical protein